LAGRTNGLNPVLSGRESVLNGAVRKSRCKSPGLARSVSAHRSLSELQSYSELDYLVLLLGCRRAEIVAWA
jgi:hypothetical protein